MNGIKRDIMAAFFPVELCNLYWSKEAENITDPKILLARSVHVCPRHYAVVGIYDQRVYQCVTENYELVTNENAVDVADTIARIVFRRNRMMDFRHKTVVFEGVNEAQCCMEFWDEEDFFYTIDHDKWLPFVQIGNSYNSTATLSYELGFRICDTNIQITFEDISIKIKDAHTIGILERLPKQLERSIISKGLDDMKFIKKNFIDKMNTLHNAYMGKNDILPLALRLFELDYKDNTDKERCKNLHREIEYSLSQHKFVESNMYYFIRLVAEIISNPYFWDKGILLRISSVQKYESKVGDLINELVRYLETRKPSDTLQKFIGVEYYLMASDIKAGM